ncbi:MAG: bacteriohemerythrin [Gammaproteobacteria bacterium]
MSLMTWTADKYGTDVGFADKEHQEIFSKLNKLYDSATGGAERSKIGQQLDDLIGYVAGHFAHEEKEMQARNFSGYDRHKEEHDALVGICLDLQKKFHSGDAEVTEEVGHMVRDWLNNHIPTYDKSYSGALK